MLPVAERCMPVPFGKKNNESQPKIGSLKKLKFIVMKKQTKNKYFR